MAIPIISNQQELMLYSYEIEPVRSYQIVKLEIAQSKNNILGNNLNPIQDGEGAKSSSISFSPKFLSFSFNTFATLLQHFSQIIDFELKASLTKNWFFWSNPYKIEVMTTPLIEMLELPNFDYMNTLTF